MAFYIEGMYSKRMDILRIMSDFGTILCSFQCLALFIYAKFWLSQFRLQLLQRKTVERIRTISCPCLIRRLSRVFSSESVDEKKRKETEWKRSNGLVKCEISPSFDHDHSLVKTNVHSYDFQHHWLPNHEQKRCHHESNLDWQTLHEASRRDRIPHFFLLTA